MCRFLLVEFTEPTKPQSLLAAFAEMSEKSKALDGDWQGDGWGVAWIDERGEWQRQTSLAPIWQEAQVFEQVPLTKTLVAHARAASFAHHKGVIEFNQPYLFDQYAFVFNGLVRGVSLPNIPGRIGAEKICHLVKQELAMYEPQEALERVRDLLLKNCKEIVALNLGLASKEGIYALNYFSQHPEYYSLHHAQSSERRVICSEPLGVPQEMAFTTIRTRQFAGLEEEIEKKKAFIGTP